MTNYDAREAGTFYGVREDNNLADAAYNHSEVDYSEQVTLDDARLVSIDRIRFLTDPGFQLLDLSYCYGTLQDGRHVRVDLNRWQFGRRTYKSELIAEAKAAGRFAKGLGMLDPQVISILWG